jgi:hypothetical protein
MNEEARIVAALPMVLRTLWLMCSGLKGSVVFLVNYTYNNTSTERICPQESLGNQDGKGIRKTPYRRA